MRSVLRFRLTTLFAALSFLAGLVASAPPAAANTCFCTCTYRLADGTERTGSEFAPHPDQTCTATDLHACGEICAAACAVIGDTGETYARETDRCAAPPVEPTATTTQGSSVTLVNPLGADITIPGLIQRIVSVAIGLVGAFALLMFIYGGIRWITAGGSAEGVTEAKKIITNATIGILLVFFSYTLITAFLAAFNPPQTVPSTKKAATP